MEQRFNLKKKNLKKKNNILNPNSTSYNIVLNNLNNKKLGWFEAGLKKFKIYSKKLFKQFFWVFHPSDLLRHILIKQVQNQFPKTSNLDQNYLNKIFLNYETYKLKKKFPKM